MRDHIVEDVRKVRKEIEKECAAENQSLGEHFKSYQKQFEVRLVRRAPQKALKAKVA